MTTSRGGERPSAPRPKRAAITAALWALVIFLLSTEPFSRANTDAWVARWSTALDIAPSEQPWIDPTVTTVRDAAHLVEFFVFTWLLHCAFVERLRCSPRAAIVIIAALATGYGLLDEIHQRFVHGRSASPWDLAMDGMGAALAGLWIFGGGAAAARSSDPTSSRRDLRP